MLIFTDIFTDKHWRRWLEMFRRPLKDIATSTLLVISLSNIGIKIECKRCTMVSCSNLQATVSISLILNAWSMIDSPIKLSRWLWWERSHSTGQTQCGRPQTGCVIYHILCYMWWWPQTGRPISTIWDTCSSVLRKIFILKIPSFEAALVGQNKKRLHISSEIVRDFLKLGRRLFPLGLPSSWMSVVSVTVGEIN